MKTMLHASGNALLVIVGLVVAGCAHLPNHYRETGPATVEPWSSPTTADIYERFESAELRHRDWGAMTVCAESGAVVHWPLYFEDPFVDKGDGRPDETDPHNVYRLGWEDWVAFPYGISRFTANWLLLPVSAIVTPPWTLMESDGELSQQLAWYDHDARRLGRVRQSSPASTDEPCVSEPVTPAGTE